MKKKNRQKGSWIRRAVTASAAVVVLFTATATGWADALYILTGVEDTAIILTEDEVTSDLADLMVYNTADSGNTYDFYLEDDEAVTVLYNGETVKVTSTKERISSLLNRLHIQPTDEQMVMVSKHALGTEIAIDSDFTYYDREETTAPHATIRRGNENLPEGTEQVVRQGRDGSRVSVYEVHWSQGELMSRSLVEEVSNDAVDEIIEYSTADSQAKAAVDEAARAAEALRAVQEAQKTLDANAAAEQAAKAAAAATAAQQAAASAKPMKAEQANTAATQAAADAAKAADLAAQTKKAADEKKAAEEAAKKAAATANLPMDKLVQVNKNANGGGTLVFASGRTVTYKYAKTMSATAYNKNEPKVGTITAMGTKVHKGVVAVDRRVIPLGTKLYVVANGYEYGYSVAEDTGVFGNNIDLYFESYQGMVNFGRRNATVYILG